MTTRVEFASCRGPMLGGIIDEPEGEPRGWGIFVHGFTLGKDSPAASRMCRTLAERGIGMLRFDCLGLGDSQGDWGDGSFTVKVEDTIRAARFMADRGTPAEVLIGHSWGGAAVIAAAGSAEVDAVVTVGAPSDPSDVERHYDAVVDRACQDGAAQWLSGGRALTLKKAFVEDVREADLSAAVRNLHRPLLIMHSPTDNTVGIKNASDIFQMARHPRNFISLEGADHLLTERGQAARAATIAAAWLDQYLCD